MVPKFKSQNGAVMVEFVLILPVLLLLIFGIMEFSFLLFDKVMVTNASREGARAGVVYSSPNRISKSEIENIALKYCQNHLISLGSKPSVPKVEFYTDEEKNIIEPPCPQESLSGSSISVYVEYDYKFLFFSNFLDPVSLGSVSTMRCE